MHRAGGGISPEFDGTTAAIFPPPVEAEETWPMAAAGIFSGFFFAGGMPHRRRRPRQKFLIPAAPRFFHIAHFFLDQ
jgi:hypothetical protein